MLDQNFCEELEYIIGKALEENWTPETKGFWCDGCLLSAPDRYYSRKYINDNRQTMLTAFIDGGHKPGGGYYQVLLKFGKKALSAYATNRDIIDCIPTTEPQNWFRISIETKEIVILLL